MMNMKLTKEQIECNKREVIELLRSTKRDGIDGLLKVMEEGGYYTAKCHSHHHYVGGLMLHSLSACRIALSKDSGLSRDSIIVCTLLHDLCDIKGYSEFGGHEYSNSFRFEFVIWRKMRNTVSHEKRTQNPT